MSTVIVRYRTKPESADENQRLIANVFAELQTSRPPGLRYASFRLDDGVTFVHVASTDQDKSPLEDVQAFQEFQRDIPARLEAKPDFQSATMIGEYGFEGAHAERG